MKELDMENARALAQVSQRDIDKDAKAHPFCVVTAEHGDDSANADHLSWYRVCRTADVLTVLASRQWHGGMVNPWMYLEVSQEAAEAQRRSFQGYDEHNLDVALNGPEVYYA